MKAIRLIRLGLVVFLLAEFDTVAFAAHGVNSPPIHGAGGATEPVQTEGRHAAAGLFNVTPAGSNMVRLGGAPNHPGGPVAISGSKAGSSSRINGQEFSRAVWSR